MLYCCELQELTVADEAMCGVRLVDRLSTFVLCNMGGVFVNIEDMIIQSRLRWYGNVARRDINSQIREAMEDEITGKRKKGRPRKSWEECVKKDFQRYGLRREMSMIRRNGESKLGQKLLTPAIRNNGIKADVVIVAVVISLPQDSK